ncbi:MAG: hypothetical protein ACTSX3_01375 [Candidatus Thorarchaeota archaeon]
MIPAGLTIVLMGIGACMILYGGLFVTYACEFYGHKRDVTDGGPPQENIFGKWSYSLYLTDRWLWYLVWTVPCSLGCILYEIGVPNVIEASSLSMSSFVDCIMIVLLYLMAPIMAALALLRSVRCLEEM